jgi:transposase
MERRELTDAQWERLVPLLPPEGPHIGRPNKSHRQVLKGILFFHRTGVPWRAIPRERFGPWKTLSSRFYRWEKASVWRRVLRALQAEAHEDGDLDWTLHFVDSVDGSVVRAHQHAAGARGTLTKGGGRSAGPKPGRVLNQAARPGGRQGPPARLSIDGMKRRSTTHVVVH